jgi:hypothetical protein
MAEYRIPNLDDLVRGNYYILVFSNSEWEIVQYKRKDHDSYSPDGSHYFRTDLFIFDRFTKPDRFSPGGIVEYQIERRGGYYRHNDSVYMLDYLFGKGENELDLTKLSKAYDPELRGHEIAAILKNSAYRRRKPILLESARANEEAAAEWAAARADTPTNGKTRKSRTRRRKTRKNK